MADIAVTKNMQPLSNEETLKTGFTHMVTIEASDINGTAGAQGDTVTVTIGETGGNFLVDKAAAYVETAFTNDPSGTLTLQVGTDGDPDNFLAATSVKTAGPFATVAGATPETEAGSYAAATDVLVARFSTQAATSAPGDITAGKVHIFLAVHDLHKLANGRASD